MSAVIYIHVAGYLFTLGFIPIEKRWNVLEGFIMDIFIIILWPLILGYELSRILKK